MAGGSASQCVQYTIVGDDLPEDLEECFIVRVVSGSSGVNISPATATVVIVDDDQGMHHTN